MFRRVGNIVSMIEQTFARLTPTLSAWWRKRVMAGVDYQTTLERVHTESGFDARYAFLIVISVGMSILGLLLPSSAVLIGAMLISPLMMPIMGLGFGLATFDLPEIRRAAKALALGSLIAIVLSAAFVSVSPLQSITSEIAVRTKPNLFDLLVALLSSVMGVYALVRGQGGAVVGVAIAIALMPPLAVVGFGIATWNGTVFWGSLLLFLTNLVTMALTAALLARLYGFGSHLSPAHTRLQGAIIVIGLVTLAIPLGLSLKQIAWETLAQRQIRDEVLSPFGREARMSQLDIDFESEPVVIRAVVLTPTPLADADRKIAARLERSLSHKVDVRVDQIDVGLARRASETAQIAAAQSGDQRVALDTATQLAQSLSLVAGVERERIVLDRESRSAVVNAAALPGATLDTYRVLERRAAAGAQGWQVRLVPPVLPLPQLSFGADGLDDDGRAAMQTAIWAGQRIPLPIRVSGSGERADAIAKALEDAGVTVVRNGGGPVRLQWAEPAP